MENGNISIKTQSNDASNNKIKTIVVLGGWGEGEGTNEVEVSFTFLAMHAKVPRPPRDVVMNDSCQAMIQCSRKGNHKLDQ